MPCSDNYESNVRYVTNPSDPKLKLKIDSLTRKLCYACDLLKKNKIKMGGELGEWHEQHEKEDAERAKAVVKQVAAAKRAQYLKDVKKRLIGQLDADEKEALGIKENPLIK